MAFIVNKITDSLTNATGSLIGRENLAKISNSLNKSIYASSKYRQFIKHGTIVQLVSRTSLRPIEIVRSANNPTQLLLSSNGQIGDAFTNAHFTILVNGNNNNLAFKNGNNFIGLSKNRLLGILTIDDPKLLSHKTKHNLILNVEFRLHEIFGSEEFFTLESCYCPGNYLSISSDNIVGFVKNKTDKTAHFQLNVIYDVNNPTPQQQQQDVAGAASIVSPSSPVYDSFNGELSKEEESRQSDNISNTSNSSNPSNSILPNNLNDAPPQYNSLYPRLPQ